MQPVCLGFRVHSGWGAMVALARESGGWQVLERRRINVVDGKIAGHSQPYHFAREQPLAEAKKHVARCAAASMRLAEVALQEVVEKLSRQHRVRGAAVLLSSGRPMPELERILASHPLIHTAEGEFFRKVFSEACEALGIPVTGIREKELAERAQAVFKKSAATLPAELAAAAKHLGPPWSQDQKAAALAAAVVLGGAGK
ncbi:MAG TPA: hypothetical protein VJ756_10385 [Terriglobales bacterium]|nr:hypothetical protein [Terriglobales bacterium]